MSQRLSPPSQLQASSASNGDTMPRTAHPYPDKASLDSHHTCVFPGAGLRRRKRPTSLAGSFRAWVVQHQISLSATLLALHILVHTFLSPLRHITELFIELSYYDAPADMYGQGPKDFFFVAYWVVAFTGLRATAMSSLLFPFARFAGIHTAKTQTRFAEQAWLLLYATVFWSLGMYLMYKTNYWLNLQELWTEFPRNRITGLFKCYYLVQLAFWLQQILVVNIEDRRKDHWQMFIHHIVTSALIITSYGYYQTKVGNVILCIMDVVDLTFPTAKMLRYSGYQKICDVVFGLFIASWFLARHVAYLMICWSVIRDVPLKMVNFGCYSSVTGELTTLVPKGSTTPGGEDILSNVLQPFLNPGGEVCYNPRIRLAFLALLLFLQGITIMWFTLIIKVAWRVIRGEGADDSRSDDEDEDEQEEEEFESSDPVDARTGAPMLPSQPVEQLVGVEGLSFNRNSSPICRSRKPGSSSATAMAIAGNRKEILNRIGCDTHVE